MSNSIRDKTVKRVTHIKRPYLGRGKESAPKNIEELFPQVTLAGKLTAVGRSLPSGSTEPLRIFALFPHLPIDHLFVIWTWPSPDLGGLTCISNITLAQRHPCVLQMCLASSISARSLGMKR